VTTIAGLSPAMCAVLQAVGEGKVTRDAFLHRRELITPGERVRRLERWQLTDAGRALLDQLGGAT
jgi:hypothetical protein